MKERLPLPIAASKSALPQLDFSTLDPAYGLVVHSVNQALVSTQLGPTDAPPPQPAATAGHP